MSLLFFEQTRYIYLYYSINTNNNIIIVLILKTFVGSFLYIADYQRIMEKVARFLTFRRFS